MNTYEPTAAAQWLDLAARLQLERQLADLPGLFEILEANYFALTSRGESDPDDRSVRVPIRTSLLDLLDRREKDGIELDPAGAADLARRANARRLGILPTLQSWVVLAEGEMLDADVTHLTPVTDASASVTTAAGWLRSEIDWIVGQQWSIELAAEVDQITRELDDLGINYDGPNESACLTADEIADRLDVSRATVYRWFKAGHLSDVGKVDGKQVFIVREVYQMIEHPPWERERIQASSLDQASLTLGAEVVKTGPRKIGMRWGRRVAFDPSQPPVSHSL